MMRVIRSDDRYAGDFGWLKTRWHFSFGDYFDPDNTSFGPLRVFNDDVIGPGGGFGMHPYRDMEIITYMLDGALEHADSKGHRGVLRPGDVQVMSAGRGIRHSEMNHSQEAPAALLQIWIEPRTRGREPTYDQRSFDVSGNVNRLVPVASGQEAPGALPIDQDATIYASRMNAGQSITHTQAAGRKAYLFVIDGEVSVNGMALKPGDQARISDEPDLRIDASADAHLLLIDLPG
jgi:redox-sensitive bicupin YhaK (pirin superfamily)